MVIHLKEKLKIYEYCLLVAFVFLMICSKNSFLYKINDWVDANAFFTVGKSMVRGIVPYRDLFEQKGPLLYLIYGVGSLISYKNFTGIFILEVFFFSIFLYYIQKIICLFTSKQQGYFILPIFTLGIVTLKSFSHGGSAEEFTLPFMAISGYYLLLYLKSLNTSISKKVILINGMIAGCILWIKYTLLGFWFGWMASIFFIQIKEKKYKEAFIHCSTFILGMTIVSLPWLIYFSINQAINDLWNIYFLVNIRSYPSHASFIDKFTKTIQVLFKNTFCNITLFFGIVIGFILLFFRKDIFYKKYAKYILLFCFLTTGIFIYIGGTNYHYYALPLSPFILIGLLSIIINIKLPNNNKLYILILLLCCTISFKLSTNPTMMLKDKKDYAQFVFADIIKNTPNASILNYGFLDGGFYLTTKTQPKYYYFMKTNIPYNNYPYMMDEQDRYINEKLSDYVIIKDSLSKIKKQKIEVNYQEIKRHTQTNNLNQTTTYILYKKDIPTK